MQERITAIMIGTHITAQGAVIADHPGGEVTIDASGAVIRGTPVGRVVATPPARGWSGEAH